MIISSTTCSINGGETQNIDNKMLVMKHMNTWSQQPRNIISKNNVSILLRLHERGVFSIIQ